MPPNCILEVDDAQKFEFSTKFDLIHIGQLMGSFSFPVWEEVNKRSYDNLQPGGWFDEAEMITQVFCDDGSTPDDAPILHSHEIVGPAAVASENPQTMFKEMRGMIEKAGFVNVQEKVIKIPFGDWPKHPVYKDAGRCNKIHYFSGIEGWTMVSSRSHKVKFDLLMIIIVAHDEVWSAKAMERGGDYGLHREAGG